MTVRSFVPWLLALLPAVASAQVPFNLIANPSAIEGLACRRLWSCSCSTTGMSPNGVA